LNLMSEHAISLKAEVDKRIKKQSLLLDQVNVAIELGAELAISLRKAEEKEGINQKQVDLVQKTLEDICHVANRFQDQKKLLQKAKHYIYTSPEFQLGTISWETKLKSYYDEELETEKKTKERENFVKEKMLPIKRKMWDIRHAGEPMPEEANADLVMMASQQEEDYLCPITKDQLVNPMKNSCGHRYSGEAIVELLNMESKKKEIGCPVPGCTQMVSRSTLSKDSEFQLVINRKARNKGGNPRGGKSSRGRKKMKKENDESVDFTQNDESSLTPS